jgi:hypothetical protein
MAEGSFFGDKALPGVGGFLGDGPAFDDGVATTIPLIGVPAEASRKFSELVNTMERELHPECLESPDIENSQDRVAN